jgi:ABC-2 type transport system permease protein
MSMYFGVFRLRFINALQYRAAALAGVSTQFAWGFMEIFAFRAFYKSNPAAFPMEFSHTVSYIWMQQAFLALFMLWFWESDISEAIVSGQISYDLVRPMDLYGRWYSQAAGNRLARAALRCMPILVVAMLIPEPYRLSLPPDIGTLFMFIISSALALGVVVAFSMLMYISLFYTISSLGVRAFVSSLSDFLSGAVVPLPFFPPRVLAIVSYLPFAAMQNMPLRIYSGDISGAGAYRGIAFQLAWLAALIIIGRLSMRRALKKVTVHGG